MEFRRFKEQVQEQLNKMTSKGHALFIVNLDKDVLWNTYLDSFPAGTNEIYRKRRRYDCSCCRNFIKTLGNVVTIENNKMISVWDINTDCTTFGPVTKALSEYVHSFDVSNVFVSKFKKIGTDHNFEYLEEETSRYEHFYYELPDRFVKNYDIGEYIGSKKASKEVFKRALDEFTQEAIETILELIYSNTLYRGQEWKAIIEKFLEYKKEYDKLTDETEKDLYTWHNSLMAGDAVARLRNHSIGTLITDVSNNIELDEAVTKFEKMVAPTNYKRPKAIYTKKMLEDAKNKIQELGYMDSLPRRHAKLDDITVNNILFVNKDTAKNMNDTDDIFAELEKEVAVNPKKFNRVDEISIEDFINNVLPTSKEIEVLLENKHSNNLMSLTAPVNKDAASMFKWNNNFGWAYKGNLADSDIKQNVKNAGGKVDGVLRFSIQWNDTEEDRNDLDAHCKEPDGYHIFFSNKRNRYTTGQLDIDIIHPNKGVPAVENITWTDIDKMQEGTYRFFVNNYSNRGGVSGFRAEIECDGEIYQFDYTKSLRQDESVHVAEVEFSRRNGFKVKTLIPSSVSSKQIWNLTTNQFVPVNMIMYSPNYWDDQKGIGNKHYFFILKDCKNPDTVNGFYNEYLKQELNPHRKVFEALGSKMKVAYDDSQLSGLGFCSTRRNELIVKVKGNSERVMKIKF